MSKSTRHGVTYSIEVEQEDMRVRGNAMASGDDDADRQVEDEILDRLSRGDTWAWCIVKVTATVEIDGEQFSGFATMGGCSYEKQEDFERDDGFHDMKESALEDLLRSLKHLSRIGEIASDAIELLRGAPL